VGDRIDVMIGYHGLRQLPPALQLADALADLDIYWHEDPITMHHLDDLARYKERVRSRVAGSENVGTRAWYREAFYRGAIDVAHVDMAWTGGLSEGRKIAALADTFDRPIAPHDRTGPVLLVANTHLVFATDNALVLETVRAHYRSYYRHLMTTLPRIEHGFACPTNGPGLATALHPELRSRTDVAIRRSSVQVWPLISSGAPLGGARRRAAWSCCVGPLSKIRDCVPRCPEAQFDLGERS
jgi:galactonate dehydratase